MSQVNQAVYNQYASTLAYQSSVSENAQADATEKEKNTTATDNKKEVKNGSTYGNPKLSDTALKYYNSLKKKYGNMNFVLVASDKKEEAEAMKSGFASSGKLTVLIDTDKIEKMATDESYRKQYEGILNNATTQISSFSASLGSSAKNVSAYGMTFDKTGHASFFAVIDKSMAKQKERLAAKAEAKKKEKKTEAGKAEKKAAQEKLEEKRKRSKAENTITVTADSWEGLLQKIKDTLEEDRSNHVLTEDEKMLGQRVDYSA